MKWCIYILTVYMFLTNVNVYAAAKTGTTFSQVQCEYFGMDWKEAYKKTLEMDFDVVRLGAYWNRIEREESKYDFSELDWQLKELQGKKTKVLLVVGMKAPRWPEYFIPDWLMRTVKSRHSVNIAANQAIRKHTLTFIEAVVTRYKDNENIVAWQVENEPLNRSGPRNWWISADYLKEEIALVKRLDDTRRPIVVNVLSLPNTFLRFFSRLQYKKNPIYETIDIAQIPAINVYARIGHQFWS
ncbi:MAG: beta-galactosidase, partial [Candidatus Omnitrophica bacterium]|nr:beta-galactosidase [Candidatus Omnitrophota bacterium]